MLKTVSMTLWKITPTLEELNSPQAPNIHSSLGIQFTQVGENFIEASMPVDSRTHQVAGLLHGGASVVLAESLGSVGSYLVSGPETTSCVGLEINASHLKAIRSGRVFGRATPIRIGRSIHVWEIKLRENSDPNSDLICITRLTVQVRTQKLG